MEEGDTLAHAVEAGAGGLDQDLDLGPDRFRAQGEGLDQDLDLGPDRFRAQGEGLALWQDQSLALKPGGEN
ncbi:UNVERIFIED_CONTAM: hypothetical protein FKN15_077635 [Acipenser sinensis]